MHRSSIAPIALLLGLAALLCAPAAPRGAQAQPRSVFGGYRTVAETEAFLREQAARYPHLASLIDFGDSWERTVPGGPAGYELLALRISGPRWPGPKPTFTVVAAMHANELPSAELAIRLIGALLAGYGQDADISWLLDEHTVVVVPILNPDGRALDRPTRKTTARFPGSDCAGVDLNRNFPYAWGGAGSGVEPCASTFRGDGPASEPETQALIGLLRQLYPGRAPLGEQPFVDSSAGALLSLHTSGGLLLYPWAQTPSPPPNGPALARFAERLAARNGYQPIPAYELYPHSGRLDDWAYAELGLAAITFELGRGGHQPPFAQVDEQLWPENAAALLHALRLSSAPYRLPAGPELEQIQVISTTAGLELRATATDMAAVHGVEVYIDLPPWRGGAALAMEPRDGALDEPREELRLLLDPGALPGPERHTLLLRARGAGGTIGPLWATWAEAGPAGERRYQLGLPLLSQ